MGRFLTRRAVLTLWTAFQLGCAGGQSGTETARCGTCAGDAGSGGVGGASSPCEGVAPRPLEQDEVTTLGSPLELAAAFGVEQQTTLRWHDPAGESAPTDTEVTLQVDLATEGAQLVPYVASPTATACADSVEFTAALRLKTADGAFDTRFQGVLLVTTASSASFQPDATVAALDGTYDETPLAKQYASVEFSVTTTLGTSKSGRDLAGALTFVGTRSLGGNNGSGTMGIVAQWPVPE